MWFFGINRKLFSHLINSCIFALLFCLYEEENEWVTHGYNGIVLNMCDSNDNFCFAVKKSVTWWYEHEKSNFRHKLLFYISQKISCDSMIQPKNTDPHLHTHTHTRAHTRMQRERKTKPSMRRENRRTLFTFGLRYSYWNYRVSHCNLPRLINKRK